MAAFKKTPPIADSQKDDLKRLLVTRCEAGGTSQEGLSETEYRVSTHQSERESETNK